MKQTFLSHVRFEPNVPFMRAAVLENIIADHTNTQTFSLDNSLVDLFKTGIAVF